LELRQRLLDVDEVRLGPESVEVLLRKRDLGWALVGVGDLANAEHQLRAALQRAREHHPDCVPTIRFGLASVILSGGAAAEAIEHLSEVHEVFGRQHGLDHPDTLLAAHTLAAALRDSGDHQRAADLLRKNLIDIERVLGTDDVHFLQTLHELALTLYNLGQHKEAEEMGAVTLARSEKLLGSRHPRTLVSRHNLAKYRFALGNYAGAITLARTNMPMLEGVLGPDNPFTKTGRAFLAECQHATATSRHLGRLRTLLRRCT
jgi:tetratricopeptide (TPR) repeat protein